MPLEQALKIFGLPSLEGLTMGTLMDRYRQAAKQSHPDKKGGSKEAFQAMQNAFETLQMHMQNPQQAQAQQAQQQYQQQYQQQQQQRYQQHQQQQQGQPQAQQAPQQPLNRWQQAGKNLGWMGGQLGKSFMTQGEKVFGPNRYNRYGPGLNWARQNV